MQAVTGAGRIIAGRYQLLDLLGQGAMGTVWRADDPVLAREVAIKEIRLPALMSESERLVLRQRTLREARVAGKLSHPGVVTVYDVVEADGNPWIVMELVHARSLERVVKEDGPLASRRVAEIGIMVLEALASAHAAGIVHRDVKPANVLVTAEGRAVLSDFGIATLEGEAGLTQAGMVMGTPGFCAPERIRGEPASPASDLWSLGATLYAAAEGHGPYQSHESAMAILASIVHSDPPLAASAGPVGPVISALMSKDPAERPDAAAAARMLAQASARRATLPPTAAMPASGTLPVAEPRGDAPAPSAPTASPGPSTSVPHGAAAAWGPAVGGNVPWPWPPGESATGPGLGADNSGPRRTPAAPAASPASLRQDSRHPAARHSGPATRTLGSATHWHEHASRGPAGHAAASARPPQPAARPAGRTGSAAAGRTGSASGPAGRTGSASGPAGRTAGSAHSRSGQRRWLPIALAAAGIVVVGMIIGALAAHGRPRGLPSAPGDSVPTAPGTAGAGLPAGYRWYTSLGVGPAAFSVALPQGWQVSQHGAVQVARDPGTGAAVRLTALPAGTSLLGQITLLTHRASNEPGFRRLPFLALRGVPGLALRFSFQRHGVGLMAGADVVARLGPLGSRRVEEFRLTTPAGDWGPARAALTEMVSTFQPQT